jgi:exopolysaccharide production protein ExoZ
MPPKDNIRFIELLRGPAALFVVWDHLVAIWLDTSGKSWFLLRTVREYITTPLGIIQDFGFFGVALFFLISGYIITHTSQNEDRAGFAIKRLFRIYPPFLISLLLIFVVTKFDPGHAHAHATLKDYVWASTLFNYYRIHQNPISGVAWTLVIEMLFYIFCIVLLTQLKNRPWLACMFSTSVCALVLYYEKQFGPYFFLVSVVCSYLPFLLMGQLLYYFSQKRMNVWLFALLSVANYLTIIYGILMQRKEFYSTSNSYVINFLYAYLVFVIFMLANKRLDNTKLYYRTVAFFSKISYSLYLNHGYLGMVILWILVPITGNYFISLMVAVPVVITYSYLSYLFVEEPSRRLARRILSRKKKTECIVLPLEVEDAAS